MARDIVALGYTREPGWQDPRGHVMFTWETALHDYGVTVQMFKYTQNQHAKPEDRRYCVENIIISAGEPFHE